MNKPVKILNVLTTVEDGGMEMLVSNIYEGLKEKGNFEFYLCTLKDYEENFLIQKFRNLGCRLVSFSMDNKDNSIRNLFRIFVRMFSLARYISRNKIEIVHSHDFFSAAITRISVLICALLFWYVPKKNFVTLHNIFFWLTGKHHLLNRILAVFTSRIICVSRSVMEYSILHDKIKQSKYLVIYNGINEEVFTPSLETGIRLRKSYGFNENDILLGNIGTLSIRKGQKYLIEAFLALRNEYKILKLLIFGSTRGHEDSVRDELFNMVKENNMNDSVFFYGSTDKIRDVYNMFDIFVMPSISEGLSLAGIEALLMERLCVFSDIGPFRELIRDGQDGFLFKSGDSKSLEDVLRKVIANRATLINMGKNSRKEIVKKFKYDTMLSNYLELYEST